MRKPVGFLIWSLSRRIDLVVSTVVAVYKLSGMIIMGSLSLFVGSLARYVQKTCVRLSMRQLNYIVRSPIRSFVTPYLFRSGPVISGELPSTKSDSKNVWSRLMSVEIKNYATMVGFEKARVVPQPWWYGCASASRTNGIPSWSYSFIAFRISSVQYGLLALRIRLKLSQGLENSRTEHLKLVDFVVAQVLHLSFYSWGKPSFRCSTSAYFYTSVLFFCLFDNHFCLHVLYAEHSRCYSLFFFRIGKA